MPPNPLPPGEVKRLQAYLNTHWLIPEDYITGFFERSKVVLLGEDHGIRHNLRLVHALIPRLHRAGVYNLGMEFGASEDQAALDDLVMGERYDEERARRLMFHYNVGWAFREYLDIYRSAWEYNRTLPAREHRFRVLNLSYRYNWAGAPLVRTPENARQIYPRGPVDAYRAEIVRREILDKGAKALILTGTPHAFTRYRLPVYDFNAEGFVRFEDRNLGQRLYQAAPGQVHCILLHQAFPGKWQGSAESVFPAKGAIDQVMAGYADQRVGFDLPGTPLGDLVEDSIYASGYQDFRLGQLADGYIYERPFSKFEGCTLDEAFLSEANWPEAQSQIPDPEWHPRPGTLAEYWQQIREYANIPRRYQALR